MRYRFILFILSAACIQACKKNLDIDAVSLTQLTVWNEAPHNAFTDLIRFNSNYYCVFREASSHLSSDGKLRIIVSPDGKNWKNFSLLSLENKDLRDPHFFIDDNNILSVASNAGEKNGNRQNFVFKLNNNGFIQSEQAIVDNDYWLWGFAKHINTLYSIGYNVKQPCFNTFVNSTKSKIVLFRNKDTACINFSNEAEENLGAKDFGCPSEASMVFTSDSTAVAIVRDEMGQNMSHIGISKFPFTNWSWKPFPYFVRGPKLTLLPDGRFLLCAASLIDYYKTYYAILNPIDFSVEKIKVFPSGGDTGYPGVIVEGNTALVSYYSSHEGNSRVYIDRVLIN